MERELKYDSWHQQRLEASGVLEEPRDPWHVTVAKLLPQSLSCRVLEVGCGRGDFALWLSDRYPGAEITGVDFSQVAITAANQKAARKNSTATFKVDNSERLSFADASFDFIITCECLEHVSNPATMAGEIFRVLRPGGKFILTTENYFNGMFLVWLKTWITGAPFDSGAGVQPHENFFFYWRVKKILERAKLKVEHMESNHYQWLLLPRTDPMKLVTFDFQKPFLKRLFRPFGRHFTFCGSRPAT